tara:strand:- start:1423 stop:2226 length:804 start_codon:yes stop_codon:yes gene_type:complete
MIYLNKKLIPNNIRILGSHIFNSSVNPFNLRSRIFPYDLISDFFIWSPIFDKVDFIAENVNGLINGKKEKINHIFNFYSENGSIIKKHVINSDEFFLRIELPKNISSHKYISFVHFAYSEDPLKKHLKNLGLKKNLKVSKQSRGYTIFTPEFSSIGASVHGNLGGIAYENIKTIKQREVFVYTPIYKFNKIDFYDLVFNNPTAKKLDIKVYALTSDLIEEISIEPMGTNFIQISNFKGGINIESKLPICRPIIFKNPNNKGFDVFHG